MRMKMKSKLLFFSTLTVIMSVLAVADSTPANWDVYTRTPWMTRGSGLNLKGKMFTLPGYEGGICFYSPYQPPPWASTTSTNPTSPYYRPSTNPTSPYYRPSTNPTSPYYRPSTRPTSPYYTPTTRPTTPYYTPTIRPTSPYYGPSTRPTSPYYTSTTRPTSPYYTPTTRPTTTHRTTTRRTTLPWTTAPTTRGLSVCLRYITDYLETSSPLIFTLSPSSSPLSLRDMNRFSFTLRYRGYNEMYLNPSIRLWSESTIGQSMWTSVCLTLDSMNGVVQMFRNTNMSMRKMMPYGYVWSGEPVIDFTGFEGQVTDVEVWDYPLRYKQVLYYMSRGSYGPYQGSVLSWSYISYSPRGKTLLEDTYELQLKHRANKEERSRRLKGEKMERKLLSKGKKKTEINKQMI